MKLLPDETVDESVPALALLLLVLCSTMEIGLESELSRFARRSFTASKFPLRLESWVVMAVVRPDIMAISSDTVGSLFPLLMVNGWVGLESQCEEEERLMRQDKPNNWMNRRDGLCVILLEVDGVIL